MNISPSSVSIGGSEQKSFALSLPCTENKTTSGIITITSNDNYKTEVCIPVRGICWGNRITITKGGTYEGNWESTDGTNPAVDIKTSEPVIIEKSWIRAKGPAKIIQGDFIKATIRDCHAYGLPSDKAGGAPSQFFRTTYPRSIVMENNYIEGASLTFFLQNSGNSTPVTKCHVRYNQVRNIDGRVKDGAKCTGSDMLPDAVGHHCATGFVAVNRLDSSDVDISWNEIINEPYKGNQDVIINFVNSRGTPAKPIRIHNNFIHGQYAVDPATEISYGGGINAGDATSGAPASKVPQFVWVYDNQVVNIMKGGVATVAGNNIKIYRNRVVSTGKLPNGTPFHDHAGGIVIWDCCYSHKSKGVWHNIEVYDNKIGYLDKNGNSKVFYDRKDCTTDVNGNSQCHDNTEIPAPITKEMEDAEYDQWLKKVNEQNIRLGPR